jgi:5-formaminoimidazole-4-carboxamide-1-(beta)-D-ribofuranosyl 5'-monophosphate synthetase
MIKGEEIDEVLGNYKAPSICVLGSHSALEISFGAKQEGLKTIVVCEKGRERVYSKHYRNLFDEVIILDKFSDMIDAKVQEKLQRLNAIFIPSRSFSVYLGYDSIENEFLIPLMNFSSRYWGIGGCYGWKSVQPLQTNMTFCIPPA